MNKIYTFAFFSLFTFSFYNAQTSTETFETETNASTSFADNGVVFNIISNVTTFNIMAINPGTGWNGTAIDNRYIDNANTANQSAGGSFSIKTTSNLFKVNSFWIYAADANTNLGVTGSVTVTGRLSGVDKFTQTKTTGFNTSFSSYNGFTLIDLSNLNGQNYSNIIIDELKITLGGNYRYAALDAFKWTKDASVLSTDIIRENIEKIRIFPSLANETINIESPYKIKKIEIYDLTGNKMMENNQIYDKINIKNLIKGSYFIKIYTDKGIYNNKFIKI